MRRFLAVFCLLLFGGFSFGCGSDNQTATSDNPIVSLAVTPATATIAPGSSQQFHAIGTLQNGSQVDYTSSVTWTSSNSAAATITSLGDQAGLAFGVGVGSAQITATTAAGQLAGANLTVGTTAFTLTPANSTLATGATAQLVATATTGGSSQDLTAVTMFSSSNTSVATVSSTGLVTAVGSGITTITGTSQGLIATTAVIVTPSSSGLTSLSITPASLVLANGTSAQLQGLGTLSNGSTTNLTNQLTYTSSNASVATVSSTGLVTAVGPGSTTVMGVSGSQSSSSQVTVNP